MRTRSGDKLAPSISTPERSRGALAAITLTLLCLAVYLPGLASIPVVDRDEARFAQASRQMFESVALPPDRLDPTLHSGGLVVPMLQGKERLNKPPLIYWLQAASAALFTAGDPLKDAIWMYRVPSLLGAIVVALATWRIGLAMLDPRAALLAGALVAVCPVFAWEAHQARADMVMVACTTLAMGRLWKIWRAASLAPAPGMREAEKAHAPLRSSISSSLCLWLPTALGILTKGPITPLVLFLTALTLSLLARNVRWLRATHPALGTLILVALLAPWILAVASRVGLDHYLSLLYDEIIVRAGRAREGHRGPPGYHAFLSIFLFWPGSLLAFAGVARAIKRGTFSPANGTPRPRLLTTLRSLRPTRRPEAFLLAWLLPSWLLFELVGTKLPHYTMPLYPPLALLAARVLLSRGARARRTGPILWAILSSPLVLALAAVPLFTHAALDPPLLRPPPPRVLAPAIPLAAAILVLWSLAIRSILRHSPARAVLSSLALIAAALAANFSLAAPRALSLSVRAIDAARDAAANPPSEPAPIGALGYHEDSLIWHTRAAILLIEPEDQPRFWAEHEGAVLILPKEHVTRSHLVLAEIYGLHYSKGRATTLAVVRPFSPQDAPP